MNSTFSRFCIHRAESPIVAASGCPSTSFSPAPSAAVSRFRASKILRLGLIHEKTDGNPFFVIQFIKMLHSEGLLTFDDPSRCWDYDLARIRKMGTTDNVVELMVRKIGRLPESTQTVVKLAACIGNAFDLHTLSIASQVSPEQVAPDLRDAVHEGLTLIANKRHRV